MEFKDQLKFVRNKLHISQTDLGKMLGVNFTTVNRLENGKSNPSYRTLRAFEKICKDYSVIIPED